MKGTDNAGSVGIKQQIQSAASLADITRLITKARGFKHIHPRTLRRCERLAMALTKEINKRERQTQ